MAETQPPTIYDVYKTLTVPPDRMPEPGGKIMRLKFSPGVLLEMLSILDGSNAMRITTDHRPSDRARAYGVWTGPNEYNHGETIFIMDVHDDAFEFVTPGSPIPFMGGQIHEKTNCACFVEEVLLGN